MAALDGGHAADRARRMGAEDAQQRRHRRQLLAEGERPAAGLDPGGGARPVVRDLDHSARGVERKQGAEIPSEKTEAAALGGHEERQRRVGAERLGEHVGGLREIGRGRLTYLHVPNLTTTGPARAGPVMGDAVRPGQLLTMALTSIW